MSLSPETAAHFWQILATASITIIVTLISFWAGIMRNMVSKSDVMHMIETQSPYLSDRQFIMERLATNKETQAAFSTALQRNTEVMNELKIQIAMLGKTLETLENRIDH